MQPRPTKLTIKVNGKVHGVITSTVERHQDNIEEDQNALDGPNVPSDTDSEKTIENIVDDSSSDYSTDNKGDFAVQCAKCFKWRLIPDQGRYEKIREHISVNPFTCESAREWQSDVSCDDPTDIEQDGTRMWAIDKPDIAQAPQGWKRLLQIRSEGSSKFADVYYTTPTGTRLRSMPDLQRYLQNHPEHAVGISLAQFSFKIPRPLRQKDIRKRPGSPDAEAVEPIAWAGPDGNSDVHIAEPIAWASPRENTDGVMIWRRPLIR